MAASCWRYGRGIVRLGKVWNNVYKPLQLPAYLSGSAGCYQKETSESGKDKSSLVEERFFDRINIKVKGYDHPVLDSYVKFVSRAANNLDIEIHGTAALPTRVKKFTVLKSPHIYKKHRVQFETRTHARLLQIRRITGTTADIFLEYIQRNLPEGVSMSLYQEAFEALPNLLMEPPSKDESKKVKKSK